MHNVSVLCKQIVLTPPVTDMIFIQLLVSGILRVSASARTVFSAVSINGIDQGHAVGIRVPTSNNPIKHVTSNDIICNTTFIQPMSNTKLAVNSDDKVTAQFHHTSAGYVGPDPTNKADRASIPSATQTDVTGLKRFKIYEDGYNLSTGQWGLDHLFNNKGNVTFTIPPCIPSSDYPLRAEATGTI
ncbi:hypothetical protein L218DRAFT_920082 [Marasmius fiardii PR-910]|nr:hypothetical protein L218DRAFT_920082 [Marasmius fiardii PR-910]